jgi:hypothetical protein
MDLINTLFFINNDFCDSDVLMIFLCINNLEHALFALTNTAAGSAAGFSIFYSSITARSGIHFFKSRPFWL